MEGNKAGEIWSIALSEDGQYLAATSFDGRISVWDSFANGAKIREFETKGSFGMSIDLSVDGRFTASGHENGGVYIFNNDTGRLFHSLPGKSSTTGVHRPPLNSCQDLSSLCEPLHFRQWVGYSQLLVTPA